MMIKETLREVVKSQRNMTDSSEVTIKREMLDKIEYAVPFAIILSGIRRCGKSTLLKQIMKKTVKFYYFNFEDPRAVNFEIADFQKLDEIFNEEYGNADCYFFDEIQNIEKWELSIRKILDNGKHVIITGSNASLLSRELGTRLTGRHLRYELFPFSYSEFLSFENKKPGYVSFSDYLKKGGFPEFLKYRKTEILQELLNDIISRDILVRHGLRNVKVIREMSIYLTTNIGKEFTYNGLMKMFNLGSANSAINLVSYLEDSYLLFTISKFDYSLKKQIVNPKKIYSIDTGMINANSASFSEDSGRLLENAVFLALKRTRNEIFYFKEKKECDFLAVNRGKVITAIQACHEINENNKEREISGLVEAMEKFGLDEGLIITSNQSDTLNISGRKIIIKPFWKWEIE